MKIKAAFLALILIATILFCSGQIVQQIVSAPAPVSNCGSPASTSLVAWYEANAGLTCTSGCSNGNVVTAWADQSSSANNLTAYLGNGGVYEGSQINGLPAVEFNGTNSQYTFGSDINLQSGLSIFAVYKLNSTSQTLNNIITGNQSGSFNYFGSAAATKKQGAYLNNISTLGLGNTTANTSWHQTNVTYNNTTINFRLGEASDGSATPSAAITANEQVISTGGTPFNGYIAELIIYNAVVSTSANETYLNCKYGI
jgi:hypothetical protein